MLYTNEFNENFEIAEIQISYKTRSDMQNRPTVTKSRDAYEILLNAWNKDTIELFEEVKVLCLNHANKVLGIWEASKGSRRATLIDISHLMAVAVLSHSSNLVLAHNHPSEHLKPSKPDTLITNKIKEACKYHEIQVLDHIILTKDEYYSFADEGLL
jgi:DNA repair protein RadC